MLKSFSVKNYMSFSNDEYTTLTFADDTNIIALFGINSSGKTNMIKAINTFCIYYQFHTANINQFFANNKDGFIVNIDSGFGTSLQGSNIKNFYTPNYLTKEEPTCFKAIFMLDNKEYSFEYAYNDNDTVFEELHIDSELIYSKNGSFKTGDAINSYLTEQKRDIDTYKNELGKGVFFLSLLAIRNVDYKGLIAFDEYINNLIYSFANGNGSQDKDSLIYQIVNNKIDIAFLNDIIVKADASLSHIELKKDPNENSLNVLREQLSRTTDDNIKNNINRHINKAENRVKIFFYTKLGIEMTYETLSSGTKKMLTLAVSLSIAAKQNKLVLIDEIENGLNAFLLHYLLELITYLDVRVIFTTHSLEILNFVSKKEIVFIKRENDIYTVLERRDLSKIKNIRDHYLKMEFGDYLPNIE